MDSGPRVKGAARPLIWSGPRREQQWQLQQRKREASTWNKLEQNMLRKCFQIQKSYVRWAPKKFLNSEWWDPCKTKKFDKSCTQVRNGNESKIQAYQPPPPQPQYQGMWLPPQKWLTQEQVWRVTISRKGSFDKATSSLAYQIPNQGDWGFSKGMLLIQINSKGKGNENGTNLLTAHNAQSRKYHAGCFWAHLIWSS